jgi:acetyl-CoA acetyltransferase
MMMKTPSYFLLGILFTVLTPAPPHPHRQSLELFSDWKFIKQDEGVMATTSRWESVTLSHTRNAIDGQAGSGQIKDGNQNPDEVATVPKILQQLGLKLADMNLVDLNETFAAQTLAVIPQLGMDPEKVNVNGGAITLDHSLGATGAKLTMSMLQELRRRKNCYGLVTLYVGGGMGGAGIVEALN